MEAFEAHVWMAPLCALAQLLFVPPGSKDPNRQRPQAGTAIERVQQQIDALDWVEPRNDNDAADAGGVERRSFRSAIGAGRGQEVLDDAHMIRNHAIGDQ